MSFPRTRNILSTTIQFATTMLWASGLISVFNQSALSDELPIEVVVTPWNIEESLLEEVSATHINGDSLLNRGGNSFADVAAQVPGLTFAGGSARPRFFQIRGVGERELFEGIPSASVAFLVDGIDFSSIGGVPTLFDIDEVTVIKGPENFQFGPAAFAGAISLRSTPPTEIPAGTIQLSAGSDDYLMGGIATGGKLFESNALTARGSISRSTSDGFRRNTFLQRNDTNHLDSLMTRLGINAQFDDQSSAELSLLHGSTDDGYDAFTIDNDLKTESDRPGMDIQESFGASLALKHKLNKSALLTNTISFAHTRLHQSFDGDWGNSILWAPFNPYDFFYDQRRRPKLISNDLRYEEDSVHPFTVGDSELLVGSYIASLRETGDTQELSEGVRYREVDSNYTNRSIAPYLKISHTLFPSITGSAGVRGDFREFSFANSEGVDQAAKEALIGGKADINFFENNDDYWFFSLARSAKPGGVNPGINVPLDRKEYNDEGLTMIEVGTFRSKVLPRLSAKITGFFGVRQHQQVKTSVQTDPTDPLTFSYFTDNAASGDLFGGDLELIGNVTDRLSFRLSTSLLKTTIHDLALANRIIDGRDQAYAPNWSYAASVDYDLSRGFFIGAGLTGQDRFFFEDSSDISSSPYHLLSARFGYQTPQWRFEVWGQNLGNERFDTRGFFFGNEPPQFEPKKYVQRGDPLHVGITVEYRW